MPSVTSGSDLRTMKPQTTPTPQPAPEACKHPRVRIVSRDDDAEYVECELCGDIFEESEFRDMEIEEKLPLEDDE